MGRGGYHCHRTVCVPVSSWAACRHACKWAFRQLLNKVCVCMPTALACAKKPVLFCNIQFVIRAYPRQGNAPMVKARTEKRHVNFRPEFLSNFTLRTPSTDEFHAKSSHFTPRRQIISYQDTFDTGTSTWTYLGNLLEKAGWGQ